MSVLSSLLYSSLRKAGVTRGPGRTPSSDQYADALAEANLLLNEWSTTGALLYNSAINSYALTSGTKSYTIGSGGTINAARPERITGATILFPTTPVVRREIRVTEDEAEWRAISVQDISSGIPRLLFNDGGNPLSTLYLWPQPDAGYSLELYTLQILTAFATTGDTISYPPGYENALMLNLAVRLAVQFGLPVNPDLRLQAQNAKRGLMTRRASMPRMRTDQMHARGGHTINWLERQG